MRFMGYQRGMVAPIEQMALRDYIIFPFLYLKNRTAVYISIILALPLKNSLIIFSRTGNLPCPGPKSRSSHNFGIYGNIFG